MLPAPDRTFSKSVTSVGNDVNRNAMETKHMVHQLIGSLFGGGELRQGNKVYRFREPINYGEYY